MMRWKFWQRETREAQPYSDAIVDLVLAQARGDQIIATSRPAVMEACSGLWARAFASATVEPLTPATAALTAQTLETIGRKLFEQGEAVFEIEVVDGQVQLVQASTYTVLGGRPHTWLYELVIPEPDNIRTVYRPADAVVHLRYASGFNEPWKGTGPIQNASTSRQLAAALELRLSQEAGAAVGNLVPVPDMAGTEGLQQDIKSLRGNNVLVPSTRSDQFTGGQTPPRSDSDIIMDADAAMDYLRLKATEVLRDGVDDLSGQQGSGGAAEPSGRDREAGGEGVGTAGRRVPAGRDSGHEADRTGQDRLAT